MEDASTLVMKKLVHGMMLKSNVKILGKLSTMEQNWHPSEINMI
jgi:hypothetical protein